MLKKPHKMRVLLMGGLFCTLAGAVIARLYVLQVSDHDSYAGKASLQQTKRVVVQAQRGDILDRKGRPIATSTGSLSVYVDPKYFKAPEADADVSALASQVSYYAGMSKESVLAKMERNAVTAVGRQLENNAAERIAGLFEEHQISRRGYWFHRESKRLYPRHLAPHLIGFCGSEPDGDNVGLSGLEFLYNEKLKGQRIEGEAIRTGISQVMQPVDANDVLGAQGNSLVLTIDAAIQETAESALNDACTEFSADAAGAVVQDTETGAILALASWPTYDNSRHGSVPQSQLRNRVLTDPIETGSVAKLFTAAILLDLGKITPDTLIDCEGGRAIVDGRRLTDSPGHYLDVVPFYEVIRYSSNVGTVKAAQVLENEEWYDYLRSFGLGQPTGIDLPGEGTGILYPTKKWTKFSRTSLPMGYEMSLTAIQIVNGITGIVNGGDLLKPHVVQEIRDSRGNTVWSAGREVQRQIIRPSTSVTMRAIMEDVVANGTGKKAQVPGFRVGGKTGTTRKSHILDRREYIASFAGVIPIQEPKVSIYVFVDNPKGGTYYASDVAAPVFQKIARSTVLQLGLVPTEPVVDDKQIPDTALASAGEPAQEGDGLLIGEGMMPDLAGVTMGEARDLVPRGVARVRFIGSGIAGDQLPPAGTPIDSSTEVVVVFSQEIPGDAPEQIAQKTRSPR